MQDAFILCGTWMCENGPAAVQKVLYLLSELAGKDRFQKTLQAHPWVA